MKSISDRTQKIVPSPTLQLDAKAKKMLSDGLDVINLSVGEPDIQTPVSAANAAIKAIHDGFTRYTEVGGIADLRRVVANHANAFLGLSYEPDQVVVSNGGKHSLYNIFATLLNPGDEVIIPAPYWVSYPEQVKLVGGQPIICHTDESTGFKATPSMLAPLISERTRAIVINSPSNPTGAVYTKAELEALSQLALQHDLYVVSDEIYDRLVFDKEGFHSIATLNEAIRERTIIVNGWSKTYGMTGWRLGYTLSNKILAKAFREFQGHTTSNVCSIAQMAAIGALQTDLSGLADRFLERRDFMIKSLAEIRDIKTVTPGGAFYVFPNFGGFIGRRYKNQEVDSIDTFCRIFLEDFNVSIVPGAGFGAPNNVRMSYAVNQERLSEAIGRLRKFVDQLDPVASVSKEQEYVV
jgi:aspartate aminotransferase